MRSYGLVGQSAWTVSKRRGFNSRYVKIFICFLKIVTLQSHPCVFAPRRPRFFLLLKIFFFLSLLGNSQREVNFKTLRSPLPSDISRHLYSGTQRCALDDTISKRNRMATLLLHNRFFSFICH